jgi:hypothetical protein
VTRRFVGLLWVLSAGITAAAFMTLPQSVLVYCIIASAVIQTGHQISPIALAWSNAGFRAMMLTRPEKFLLLPVATFALVLSCPFWWVWYSYWAWNAYHYGMQNFGVLSLWRRPKRRWLAMAACLIVTSGPMLLLFIWKPHWQWLFVFGAAMQFNHWIVDIGLSGRVSRHTWLFVGGILVAGLVGFIWYEPTARGFHRRSDDLLQVAMALGFVHFLYSRWVWKMSDPQVRATIGADLFRGTPPAMIEPQYARPGVVAEGGQ